MTRLEQCLLYGFDSWRNFRAIPTGEYLDRDEAIAAARLDAEDAYRRGVEDGERLRPMWIGNAYLEKAKQNKDWWIQCRAHMKEAQLWWDKAFHGARGIDRVIVRQRLERLKEGNGNG